MKELEEYLNQVLKADDLIYSPFLRKFFQFDYFKRLDKQRNKQIPTQSRRETGVYRPGDLNQTIANVGINLESEGREDDYFNIG